MWQMNEYQKTFDMCLKIFVYGCVALYFLGFLKFLPDDLSDRIAIDEDFLISETVDALEALLDVLEGEID